MNELVVIVEGETEQAFVRDQLAGHLAIHGTSAWAVLPGRKRNRSGVKKWEVARQDIVRTLKERRFCSTMMDYYGMPKDWPGRHDSAAMQWQERAAHVEKQISKDVEQAMGNSFDPRFFIPYIQLHEFEALAFSDIQGLTSVLDPLSLHSTDTLNRRFMNVLEEAGHPEAIDDGYETCPSRRIMSVVRAYKKRVHGPIITRRIGLDVLREKCDHFASWLKRIESIGAK